MADTLWDFSLRIYGDEATQHACLALQDAHGADVNVALYLLWRASHGETLREDAVRAVDQAVEAWRTAVVAPLRAIRRAMKDAPLGPPPADRERLRSRVKALELEAEKTEQSLLADLVLVPAREAASPGVAATSNLGAYAATLETAFPEDLVSVLVSRLEDVAGG